MKDTLEASIGTLSSSVSGVNNFFTDRPLIEKAGLLSPLGYGAAKENERQLSSTVTLYRVSKHEVELDRARALVKYKDSTLGQISKTLVKGLVGGGAWVPIIYAVGPVLTGWHVIPILGMCATMVGISLRSEGRCQDQNRLEAGRQRAQLLLREAEKYSLEDCLQELYAIADAAISHTPMHMDALSPMEVKKLYSIQQAELPLYRKEVEHLLKNISQLEGKVQALGEHYLPKLLTD